MDKRRRTSRATRHLHAQRRRCSSCISRARTMKSSSKAVARKMEALRELIPLSTTSGGEKKLWKTTVTPVSTAERLFGETAEYILALRTQVEILKQLVDFHSAPSDQMNGRSA